MVRKLGIFITVFIALISLTNTIDMNNLSFEEIKQMAAEKNKDRHSIEIPLFVYFHFKKDLEIDMEFYKRIIYQFLATVNLYPNFVDIDPHQLMCQLPKGSKVDKEAIEDVFSDVMERVEVLETVS